MCGGGGTLLYIVHDTKPHVHYTKSHICDDAAECFAVAATSLLAGEAFNKRPLAVYENGVDDVQ